jgi:hypothetical protein
MVTIQTVLVRHDPYTWQNLRLHLWRTKRMARAKRVILVMNVTYRRET